MNFGMVALKALVDLSPLFLTQHASTLELGVMMLTLSDVAGEVLSEMVSAPHFFEPDLWSYLAYGECRYSKLSDH